MWHSVALNLHFAPHDVLWNNDISILTLLWSNYEINQIHLVQFDKPGPGLILLYRLYQKHP